MPRNPLALNAVFNVDHVANAMLMLWRDGSRHPMLAHEICVDLFPGIPINTYNQAADAAWSRLSPEERREAAEEAGGAPDAP